MRFHDRLLAATGKAKKKIKKKIRSRTTKLQERADKAAAEEEAIHQAKKKEEEAAPKSTGKSAKVGRHSFLDGLHACVASIHGKPPERKDGYRVVPPELTAQVLTRADKRAFCCARGFRRVEPQPKPKRAARGAGFRRAVTKGSADEGAAGKGGKAAGTGKAAGKAKAAGNRVREFAAARNAFEVRHAEISRPDDGDLRKVGASGIEAKASSGMWWPAVITHVHAGGERYDVDVLDGVGTKWYGMPERNVRVRQSWLDARAAAADAAAAAAAASAAADAMQNNQARGTQRRDATAQVPTDPSLCDDDDDDEVEDEISDFFERPRSQSVPVGDGRFEGVRVGKDLQRSPPKPLPTVAEAAPGTPSADGKTSKGAMKLVGNDTDSTPEKKTAADASARAQNPTGFDEVAKACAEAEEKEKEKEKQEKELTAEEKAALEAQQIAEYKELEDKLAKAKAKTAEMEWKLRDQALRSVGGATWDEVEKKPEEAAAAPPKPPTEPEPPKPPEPPMPSDPAQAELIKNDAWRRAL